MKKAPWEFALWGPICAPLGALYGAAMAWRRRSYRRGTRTQHRFPVPVISVGNLTAGGVGKTPMVAALLDLLADVEIKVVLSRGYGAQVGALNDEGDMLARRFPGTRFLQGRDRIKAAEGQLDGVRVIILDDGAQHLAIARDLDILIFDARTLAAPRFILPAGPWREDLGAARDADILVLSRVDEADADDLDRARKILRGRFPHTPVVETRHAATGFFDGQGRNVPLAELRGQEVLAVSAIGMPESFETTLGRLGARVVRHLRKADHSGYTEQDSRRVNQWLLETSAHCVVTTEKDWHKLLPVLDKEAVSKLRVLRVELDSGEGEIHLRRALEELGLL